MGNVLWVMVMDYGHGSGFGHHLERVEGRRPAATDCNESYEDSTPLKSLSIYDSTRD